MLTHSPQDHRRRLGATSPIVVALLAGIFLTMIVLIVVLLTKGRSPTPPPQSPAGTSQSQATRDAGPSSRDASASAGHLVRGQDIAFAEEPSSGAQGTATLTEESSTDANRSTSRVVHGDDVAVAIQTTERTSQDASTGLAGLLKDLPNRVLRISVKGEPQGGTEPKPGVVRLRIPIELSVDKAAYTSRVGELQALLDRSAVKKFVATAKLWPQDPESLENRITNHAWESLHLTIPAQSGVDTVAFPPSHHLAPVVWYMCYSGSYCPYRHAKSVYTFEHGAYERAHSVVVAANRALYGGIDDVNQLQKQLQQPLVAVVTVSDIKPTGTFQVTTYAVPEAAFPGLSHSCHSRIVVDVKLVDSADAQLDTQQVEIGTHPDPASGVRTGGLIVGTNIFWAKHLPKTIGIWPGLFLGGLYRDDGPNQSPAFSDGNSLENNVAIVESCSGNVYAEVASATLKSLRRVALRWRCEPLTRER